MNEEITEEPEGDDDHIQFEDDDIPPSMLDFVPSNHMLNIRRQTIGGSSTGTLCFKNSNVNLFEYQKDRVSIFSYFNLRFVKLFINITKTVFCSV